MQIPRKFPDLEIRSTRVTALAVADKRAPGQRGAGVARVWACVASTVDDRWGPRVGVAKKTKKGPFAPPGGRIRALSADLTDRNHWGVAALVIQRVQAVF